MIAIYSQGKKMIISNEAVIYIDINFSIYLGNISIGEYTEQSQAQYVLDQIASTIERKDTLYRMPSVEEVEKELKTPKKCDNCRNENNMKLLNPCHSCVEKYDFYTDTYLTPSNWQPKE